jgi:hypothetical protein
MSELLQRQANYGSEARYGIAHYFRTQDLFIQHQHSLCLSQQHSNFPSLHTLLFHQSFRSYIKLLRQFSALQAAPLSLRPAALAPLKVETVIALIRETSGNARQHTDAYLELRSTTTVTACSF